VKLPSGGLGLQNAKIARPLLPGAPSCLHTVREWDTTLCLHERGILSHYEPVLLSRRAVGGRESEKLAGYDHENVEGTDRDALQFR
jgi:hypothetical protein